jgi:pimeloyl-ACP methyl ester carboxylesterase
MDEHVEDLQALIRSLDAAPAHLVGHSYGAFLCLLLAMRKPELVRTLVLAEPPVITLFVSNNPTPLEILRLLATRPRTAVAMIRFGVLGAIPARKAFERDDVERGIRAFGNAVFGPGGYEALAEPQRERVADNRTNIKAELLGPGFVPLDSGKLRGIGIPTLLVTGQQSIGLFHRLTDALAELLPATERCVIPQATHAMHEDNSAAFNAAVLAFIARYGQVPADRSGPE